MEFVTYFIGGFLTLILSLKQCHAGCSSHKLSSRSGVIQSPSYQSVLPSCIYWYISTPSNTVITISFDSIHMMPSYDQSCGANVVTVGPMPEHTFCGYESRTYIARVRKNHVWIKYNTSDYNRNHFHLRYIVGQRPSPTPCYEGETRCNNGKCILSEWRCNGRRECGDSSDEICTQAPATTAATGIAYPKGVCGTDQIACYGVTSGRLTCVGLLYQCDGRADCLDGLDEMPSRCAQKTTPQVTCSLPSLLCRDVHSNREICLDIRFQCDGSIHCHGSVDEKNCPSASSVCLKTLTGSHGHFSSPMYPQNYPNNKDCFWVIHVGTSRNIVQLRFTDFILQSEKYTDIVEVYDGKNMDSNLIGTYYGSNLPPSVIESTSNWMYVRFHSDNLYTERGFNATYQIKGYCIPYLQRRCIGESDCYNVKERCDGIFNCPKHGYDEQGCHGCDAGMFSCGPREKCYPKKERCNGKNLCLNYHDEYNCTSQMCGTQNGLFLCKNKHCIFETWQCDRSDDCGDNSDEEGCPSPFFTRRVIVAAVTGSLICSLLLVIALGCICKVYALRVNEQNGPRHDSPLSRLQAEFIRRRAPPPPYHEAMLTSRPYEEVRQDYLRQTREQRRRRSSDRRRNRPLPPTPEEPSTYQTMNEIDGDHELGTDDDVPLLSLDSTTVQHTNIESSSTADLIPTTNFSETEDSQNEANNDDDDDDDDDSVLLDLNDGVLGSATWRSRSSDDEGSPEHVPSEAGGDSIDSASASISVDNIALHETLDKENGVEADDSNPLTGVLDINKDSSGEQSTPGHSPNSLSPNNDLHSSVEEPIKTQ